MFQPVLPLSGYSGWRFLERTLETQREAFADSPTIRRNTDYFREKIGSIRTAEGLVNDRRLLEVALGAFGLDDDISSKAFIREVLQDGTLADDALANRLSDKRYRLFSEAFGFGNLGARTATAGFAQDIVERFEAKRFEVAVGEQDSDMRLALGLSTDLADIVGQDLSDDARWFTMMGNPPLRKVFETAFGLPAAFGQADIDKQLDTFRENAASAFGIEAFSDFGAAEQQEDLIRLYLLRSQVAAGAAMSSGTVALNLLQAAPLTRA